LAKRRSVHGPFKGCITAIQDDLVPRHYLGPDSSGYLLDPLEGAWYRRGGSAYIGSSSGITEFTVGTTHMRVKEIFEVLSPSLDDGYRTHGALLTDEANRWGTVYLRDTNGGGADYNLLEEYSNGAGTSYTYPTGSSGQIPEFMVMPWLYRDGGSANEAVGYSRGTHNYARRYVASGSRKRASFGEHDYLPNYNSQPERWNRKFNISTSGDGEYNQLFMMGHIPPLDSPICLDSGLPSESSSTQQWRTGDQFFLTIAFMFEDGSVGPWFRPRDLTLAEETSEYTNRYGLVTVPGTAGYYRQYLQYSGIAIGPPGTVARLIGHSPKVDSTVAGNRPNPDDIRITGILRDNITKTYQDPNGNDLALVDDPRLVRFDHRLPPCSRYNFAFDHRHCLVGLRENPAAIVIAPSTRQINERATDTAMYGTTYWLTRITSSALTIRKTSSGTTTTQSFTLSSYTLQGLVDAINATLTSDSAGQWSAALLPLVNPSTPATYLAATTFDVTNCSGAGGVPTLTTSTTDGFLEVAVGMRVTISGTAYTVIAKASNASMTLSGNPAVFGPSTLTFHYDFGDDNATLEDDSSVGNQRCFGGAWPGIVGLKESYLDTLPDRPYDLIYTAASPGDPPNAANSFFIGNVRSVPTDLGYIVAGAPLLDGGLILCSKGIARLTNIRGGKSGDDADYRVEPWLYDIDCISPWSVVSGDGWVGWLSSKGYCVADHRGGFRVISGALFRSTPTGGAGDMLYEIGQCRNAADQNGGTGWQFFAHVREGRLWVSYRTDATHRIVRCYDFSLSLEASGIDEVLNGGEPYGWSTALTYKARALESLDSLSIVSCIGSVRRSDGVYLIGSDELNDGTYTGLLVRFENGTYTENVDAVGGDGYILETHNGFEKVSSQRIVARYTQPSTTSTLNFYRRLDRTGGASLTLAAETNAFGWARKELPQRERTVAEHFELAFHHPATGAQKIWQIGVEYETAEAFV